MKARISIWMIMLAVVAVSVLAGCGKGGGY
jgi:predicted small lipoprotein YifL